MKLNFKKLGSGQPLLILHGLFGSLDNWMSLAKHWSQQYEVWLIDQRNHGQSPHSEEFNYSAMADDLLEFLEEHSIKDPFIIGHSMGGKTAMEFAVQHPELVKKLMVVDIAPVKYQVHHYAILEALNSLDLKEIKSRKEAEEKLEKSIDEIGVRLFLLKNLYWKESEKLAWRFNLEVIEKNIIPISEWNISSGKYNGPCLFVKGSNSNYILPSYASQIEEKFPNYELHEIKNAGHWVHAEAPKEFVAAIESFMKV